LNHLIPQGYALKSIVEWEIVIGQGLFFVTIHLQNCKLLLDTSTTVPRIFPQ